MPKRIDNHEPGVFSKERADEIVCILNIVESRAGVNDAWVFQVEDAPNSPGLFHVKVYEPDGEFIAYWRDGV